MRIVCLYVLILFAVSANAQIASTVVDKATNNALSKASVRLQNTKDSIVNTTVTQDSGSFSFTNIADGHYILTASFIGYNDYTVGI